MNNYSEWTSLITFALSVAGFLIGFGWFSAWWVSKKFGEVHDNIDDKILSLEKNIIQKLEYHERHDDTRFKEIRDAVWNIKIRNAAIDGLNTPARGSDA